MDCTVAVASGSHLSSPLPFTAKPATQPAGSATSFCLPTRRLFSPLDGPRSRRTLPPLVAISRRDNDPHSPDNDTDPPSTSSSSFPSSTAGRIVDEGMLVLRKRIHDAEMAERNYEPPHEWADWERAYYTRYGSDVFAALGILQSFLLATRPAVALGTATVIAMSLPLSVGAVVFAVLQSANAVGAGVGLW